MTQDIPIDFAEKFSEKSKFKARVLDKNGNIKLLNLEYKNNNLLNKSEEKNLIKMANKISKVELLGNFLREGEFNQLFNLVGIINQSDPNQIYLRDAEKIYSQRYQDNKELKDLYNILICQILQREVSSAEKTIDLILELDYSNGNAQLAKSIINIYLLDKKDARISLNNAKIYEKSKESSEIINTIEGLTYLLEFKIIKAYQLLT